MKAWAEEYYSLLKTWCDQLVSMQMLDTDDPALYGGIVCPACGGMHGRVADAILPMMYMADRTGEDKYLACARGLFTWSDRNMYQPEKGCYVNDVCNPWTGITVFFNAQLGEALQSFSHLLTQEEVRCWRQRYFRTAEYVREYIEKIGATVNYPMTAAYAMALAAELSEGDEKEAYAARARELAQSCCTFILDSGLIFGEGHPMNAVTPKGAHAIDMDYNMEESIPALLEYCHLTGDRETEALALKALETHLKFFLPDGAMDNSFGSRSYKWAYWGSRTSDSIQAVAELYADKCPTFLRIARNNAKLLRACTQDGLLYGGPMLRQMGEKPCIHHTFCHAKSFAKALMIMAEQKKPIKEESQEEVAPSKAEYFPDVRTWLVHSGKWRATLTDYDYEYCPASHATGGAMTLLWHNDFGPVCAGTMNRYHIVEPNNMQSVEGKDYPCLTPRIVYEEQGMVYQSIQDLTASFTCEEKADAMCFHARGRMVDEEQQGEERYEMTYSFDGEAVKFRMTCSKDAAFLLPVIAEKKDRITYLSPHAIQVHKASGELLIQTDGAFSKKDPDLRWFNPVGGFAAYPAEIRLSKGRNYKIEVTAR